MKLKTFFQKFDLLGEAPGAFARMRELVLRMATTGQLAQQDPQDQPASALLAEICAVRDSLTRRGAAKSCAEGGPIRAGDTSALPATWSRCMISEVCELQTGATPSRQVRSYFGGAIPWLVSGDINRGEIFECDGRITEEGLNNSNCKVVAANSVLIALNGQGKTRASVALLRIDAAMNQSLVAMIPFSRDRLLPEYIFWNLRGRYRAIRDITGQNQRRGLNMKLVGQLSIPIPPLAEQKRIVAKVEELMTLCDRLEAQQREREARHATLARASLARLADAPTPANLEFLFHKSYDIAPADLRKSILTLAFQGKLVRQGPNDEPAECLLQRLARECIPEQRPRSAGLILSPFAEDALPYELPGSWAWARFSDVAIIASNLVKPDAFLDFTHLAPDNVEKGTGVLLPCATVREDKVISSNHRFFPGQIIYSKIRPNLAKVVLVDFEGLCSADMYPIDPLIDARYLQRYMLSDTFLVQAVKADTRVAMPKINQTELNAVAVPVPPLAEQRRIVARVEELMALVDKLEAQLDASRAIAASYLESVVHELSTARREV